MAAGQDREDGSSVMVAVPTMLCSQEQEREEGRGYREEDIDRVFRQISEVRYKKYFKTHINIKSKTHCLKQFSDPDSLNLFANSI